MSSQTRKKFDPRKRKPGFQTYYDLGVEVAKHLKPNHTFVYIGQVFGISRQSAYVEVVVALGKLCWRARRQIQMTKEDIDNL